MTSKASDLINRLKKWAGEHPALAALTAAAVGISSLLYLGSAMVVNGVVIGGLIASAFGILIYKVGRSENRVLKAVYSAAIKHPLATDLGVTAVAFLIAPAGVTGYLSAAVSGLICSVWLFSAHQPAKINGDQAEERDLPPSVKEVALATV